MVNFMSEIRIFRRKNNPNSNSARTTIGIKKIRCTSTLFLITLLLIVTNMIFLFLIPQASVYRIG